MARKRGMQANLCLGFCVGAANFNSTVHVLKAVQLSKQAVPDVYLLFLGEKKPNKSCIC